MNTWRIVSLALASALLLTTPVASAQDNPQEQEETRTLEQVAVIEAPVEHVWAMFTEAERMKTWLAPVVDIDLRVGGLIRTNYNPAGSLDDEMSIHNRILAFEKEHMLSMQNVKAPTGFPFSDALKQTWSVIYFEPLGAYLTKVRMVGLGWGRGEEWDGGYEFFKIANQRLLDQLSQVLEAEHGIDEGEGVDDSGPASFALFSEWSVGEWKHAGENPDLGRFVSENHIEHAGDGKTLVSRGWLTMGNRPRFRHGDTLIFLDPETQQIRYLNVNEQGHIAEGFIHRSGERSFYWDWHATTADGNSSERYRITMEFMEDSDSYRMIMHTAEAPADAKPLIDIVFERRGLSEHTDEESG